MKTWLLVPGQSRAENWPVGVTQSALLVRAESELNAQIMCIKFKLREIIV
jgi:hypothetical protein